MLHPHAKALLDLLVQHQIPPTHTLSVAQARSFYRDRRAITQPSPPPISLVKNLAVTGIHGNIGLRLYHPTPEDSNIPVLVYFHGGGWVIGDLDTHDTLCRELALAASVAVVAVDYRMGPEFPFPCAVDDCWAALQFVANHADQLGVDCHRLAVGGDSAGGNLAAVMALTARDRYAQGLPSVAIAFQLLIYPATDMRRVHPSHTTNGQGYLLTSDTIRWFHDHYINDTAQDLDWRASPLLADTFEQLPPALVLTAGYDPLRDEGIEYAHKLTLAGVNCQAVSFERQIHGFITMGGILDEARHAVQLCASSLKLALNLPKGDFM